MLLEVKFLEVSVNQGGQNVSILIPFDPCGIPIPSTSMSLHLSLKYHKMYVGRSILLQNT